MSTKAVYGYVRNGQEELVQLEQDGDSINSLAYALAMVDVNKNKNSIFSEIIDLANKAGGTFRQFGAINQYAPNDSFFGSFKHEPYYRRGPEGKSILDEDTNVLLVHFGTHDKVEKIDYKIDGVLHSYGSVNEIAKAFNKEFMVGSLKSRLDDMVGNTGSVHPTDYDEQLYSLDVTISQAHYETKVQKLHDTYPCAAMVFACFIDQEINDKIKDINYEPLLSMRKEAWGETGMGPDRFKSLEQIAFEHEHSFMDEDSWEHINAQVIEIIGTDVNFETAMNLAHSEKVREASASSSIDALVNPAEKLDYK